MGMDTDTARIEPDKTGYADVNGLHMYYEMYGEGSPLVLLHGGMMTIDLNFATLIPALAGGHQVIGVEMQGHGRTGDIEREITPAALASDVVGLLDHLGIDRAHVLGHSMGGAVTLELGVNHGGRVRSLVPISASVRPDGMHEDLTDPAKMATSTRLPTQQDFTDFQEAYRRLSPHPEHFNDFLTSMSQSAADLQGWSDEQLAGITAPALLVLGDRDFVTAEHGALMQKLIPGSQLAVLPDTTHMQATRRADLLLPMLASFLG
jgi:pimeloyl-ACP methyl ester carboxylesterase